MLCYATPRPLIKKMTFENKPLTPAPALVFPGGLPQDPSGGQKCNFCITNAKIKENLPPEAIQGCRNYIIFQTYILFCFIFFIF